MTPEVLTGKTQKHLKTLQGTETLLHKDAVKAFEKLKKKGASDGFDIAILSSFRDFSTQLTIWNEKAQGKRPLLDEEGKTLDISIMTPEEVVFAILRWSALPGASRHHWGTEIDVYAGNLKPDDYKVQLSPLEIAPGGIFESFSIWLDKNLPLEGFFRPYWGDRGGFSPEWWHLSYAPIADKYLKKFTLGMLKKELQKSDIELKDVVLKNVQLIYEKYVMNID